LQAEQAMASRGTSATSLLAPLDSWDRASRMPAPVDRSSGDLFRRSPDFHGIHDAANHELLDRMGLRGRLRGHGDLPLRRLIAHSAGRRQRL
jgi:hypothetical protein